MQIVRAKTTNRVYYVFANAATVDLTDHLQVGQHAAWDINATTHEIVSGAAPVVWIGGGLLTFDAGTWGKYKVNAFNSALADLTQALRAEVRDGVRARLNAFAATRDYDSIIDACSQAGSADPELAADGARAIVVRDAHRVALRGIWADVRGLTRAIPGGYADIVAELPAVTWE